MEKRYFLTLAIAICFCTGVAAQQKTARVDESLTIFSDVFRQLDMNYVDTLNYEQLTETAINAMLRKVDPYTVYFPKKKDDDLRMMTQGKYGGIGALIQQREVKGERQTFIANPYEGKPAQRNGVWAGDRIISVDGISTKGQTVSEVSNNLRGVPGTTVTLVLEREGVEKPFTKSFAREDIHLDAVDYYCTVGNRESDMVRPGDRTSLTAGETPASPVEVSPVYGYISFREFTENSARDFAAALDDLYYNKHIQGLIIDLRGNGGGIVDEAILIVNLFVDKDTEVVSTKGKTQASCRHYITQSPVRFPDMPLVVLVDKNSASASEIVSGSLQDLKRATIIGQRTFGKGLVQNVRPIAYDGHLKVTTSKYYLPSGRCIQAIDYAEQQKGNALKRDTAGGILPDIVMEDSAKVDICYSLYIKNMFFDYATRYHRMHDSIAAPEVFTLTDEEIEDFCRFLDEKEFTYETETSKYFADMLDMARHEDIDSTTMAALEALQPALKPSFREAIARNIEEVKQMLGSEIVLRYYYQKGQIAYQLRFDKELERAIEQFENL
ncbi:MAG: S41 family peptidase [Paludibacteraceae bacterium]|nr:S41 family peptidase [Paludibacteraceae bacterium]